uniref:ferric-chelate reductase (NADH) n=1 Tax=Anthurium amnicola TaxID=1678845 RepID=A0A1D1YKS8_9ARAE
MAELSASEPLLSKRTEEPGCFMRSHLPVSLGKWVLKILMWVIFIAWVGMIFLYPSDFGNSWFWKLVGATQGSIFGITGSIFLIFSAPVLVISFLAYAYVAAHSEEHYQKKIQKFPRFRLWTFPVLVDGPFGVVSAAEFIGIILFIAYVIGAVFAYAIQMESQISEFPIPSKQKSYLMLEMSGLRLGSIGLFCTAFLFLPVARGSIILRLIDIPFEHATRYHVWLGHLTMMIFTLHGICYIISWTLQGHLLHEMLEWKSIGIVNLAGVISLLAGLLMWVTSLHPIRKRYFELFFYTHQLYLVFVIFLAMHVGDFIFSMAAGGIFLFILDRFLRFCQSRTTVNLISAACLPCGTVELVISKPAGLKYNALSFIFLQVRELSRLQWHPFSVSSSPLDGRNHISILIKVLGEWTEKLREIITSVPEQPHAALNFKPNSLTASVEGPYGHEVAYHLMYENLILVAGGIGISPFLAVLSDILHRIEEKRPCLPRNILVIWAVKKSKELSLLSVVDSQHFCTSFSDKLNLDIQSYVTQESEPSLEEGKIYRDMIQSSLTMTNGSQMSNLVGTGNNLWAWAYFLAATTSFVISFGLLEMFYIRPHGISSWWYRGLLFIICMVASVIIFGGLIVFFWHHMERGNSSYEKCRDSDNSLDFLEYNKPVVHDELTATNLMSLMTTHYGCRPDFQDLFNSFSERVGHVDVGVLVCGPPGLQTSVAKVCRRQNIRGRWNQPIFHFNSHSFDL